MYAMEVFIMNISFIKKTTIIKLCIIAFFIITAFGLLKYVKVQAVSPNNRIYVCTSVKIEEDDTLWSIAQKYYSSEYEDVSAYVKEIKKANNLEGDTILEGNYIVVPYYVDKY